MSIFATIFGAGSVVEKGLDLIDDCITTDTEKEQSKIDLLKAYQPYKISQRLIALMITATFLVVFVVLLLASFFVDVSGQLTLIESYMSSDFTHPLEIIMVFYFGGGAVEGALDKFKRK
jgi:hypothetical protein